MERKKRKEKNEITDRVKPLCNLNKCEDNICYNVLMLLYRLDDLSFASKILKNRINKIDKSIIKL